MWVKMSFHVKFHLPGLLGSALKVFVVVGGWMLKVILVFSFGPNLWFRLWIWTWTKLNISSAAQNIPYYFQIINNYLNAQLLLKI